MPTTTIIPHEGGMPIASVKIIRFYYICIACVLTGAATFITGIIGTAVNYSNFAASAGTGIWTSMFVIAAGGLGIAIKSNSRNEILLKFFLATCILAVIFSGLMIILFIVALSTYAHPASVPYSAAAIAFAIFNLMLTGRLCKIYSETLESLAAVNAAQNIQTISTQQSILQILQHSNQQATMVPPSYSNEPPPSYATSMSMSHAAFKETAPVNQSVQLPNIPQTQPPPY